MLVSKALRLVPETAPANEEDRRPYQLVTRANAAVKAAKVTVTQTQPAVELTAGLANRRRVYIKSLEGNGDIYVGGAGVSSANGYLLRELEELWVDLTPDAKIYGVSGLGSQDVRVLEAGV